MNQDDIKEIFNKRSNKLKDHDPWRYGESLSLKTDLIEIEWIRNNCKYKKALLDIGCGTGRHVIELSGDFDEILAADFAQGNINVLNTKIAEMNICNIQTVVSSAQDITLQAERRKFDIIIGIGLVQYLNNDEFFSFFEDCHSLLNNHGRLLLKIPMSETETFSFDGYSELLESEYFSFYRNINDIFKGFYKWFSLYKLERVFTLENLGKELWIIENHDNSKQIWFLLVKKETEEL